MSIEHKYKKLTDIEHVLARPGMYVGNITAITENRWILDDESHKMVSRTITYNPALLKIFDEILSNSLDESKRSPHLTHIEIKIDPEKEMISVWDNGGIPILKHQVHQQWIPEMIFHEMKAGSNFNDDEERITTGTHGVGASLTNIFSKKFIVKTDDGVHSYKQVFSDNNHKKTDPEIGPSKERGTEIIFYPDFDRFQCNLDEGNLKVLEKRVLDAAGTNPNLKIKLNGKLLKINSFEDYIKLYVDDFFYEESQGWKVGIAHSDNGFTHVSFVNGTETKIGGSHVNYILNQLTGDLREYVERKLKVKVKPSDIREKLFLFVDCTVVRPQYSSQTKEELTTPAGQFKYTLTIPERTIKKILKSEIMASIMDLIRAKTEAEEAAALRKAGKEAGRSEVKKLIKLADATEKTERNRCILFLTEGDSAAKAISGNRDARWMGSFPLKGKPINVRGVPIKKLAENEEFKNIMTALGLQIGKKVTDISDLRYGRIGIATDADLDGNHITGLLINMFYQFWPELFDLQVICKFQTPIIRVEKKGQKTLNFFTLPEFRSWYEANPDYKGTISYYKGLGTFENKDFKEFMVDVENLLVPIIYESREDAEVIDLLFNKDRADDRKEWLNLI